jgi:hypothetical protein
MTTSPTPSRPWGYVLALTPRRWLGTPRTTSGSPTSLAATQTTPFRVEARAVLLLDELGRTTLERVAAEVQERVRAWRAGADDDAVSSSWDHPTASQSGDVA